MTVITRKVKVIYILGIWAVLVESLVADRFSLSTVHQLVMNRENGKDVP